MGGANVHQILPALLCPWQDSNECSRTKCFNTSQDYGEEVIDWLNYNKNKKKLQGAPSKLRASPPKGSPEARTHDMIATSTSLP
jgi:hypothetical protein